MFKIIEQPNDFVNNIKAIEKSNTMNESMARRVEFWTRFNEILTEKGLPFNKRKASTDHWYDVAVGSSKCHVEIDLVNKQSFIRVNMIIPESKEQYDNFLNHKSEIENSIGYPLTWYDGDGKKLFSIYTRIEGLDFNNKSNYDQLMEECISKAVEFRKAFKPFLI